MIRMQSFSRSATQLRWGKKPSTHKQKGLPPLCAFQSQVHRARELQASAGWQRKWPSMEVEKCIITRAKEGCYGVKCWFRRESSLCEVLTFCLSA